MPGGGPSVTRKIVGPPAASFRPQAPFENATRARQARMPHRARNEEEISLVQAIDAECRRPVGHSGLALRVGGGGGSFAASHLLGVCLYTASSVLLANDPPAPPTRSRGVLKRSLDPR